MLCADCGGLKHKGACTICPECDGRGEVEIEVVRGGVDQNGPWQNYHLALRECGTCHGRGKVEE